MIILSAGMQKSGSAWFFNMTNDLLVAAGHQDACEIRERFHLQSVLMVRNCNIGELTRERLSPVLVPHLQGNTFVIKTHCEPTPFAMDLQSRGILKPAFIFRDPRDVVLSTLDHGRRIRAAGENHTFAHYDTFEKAVAVVKEWLEIYKQWTRLKGIYTVRYEDLLLRPAAELERLADCLELHVTKNAIEAIVQTYREENLADYDIVNLHFNKGESGRFRTLMSQQEQHYCLQQFSSSLKHMGCVLSSTS